MRSLVYVVALMALWGASAPVAGATPPGPGVRALATSGTGAQVEFGAVRANSGTLYAVQNSGGSSLVSTIGPAGWNTCTSGYSLAGFDFEQNGFWLCARSDLAQQAFYVGNVVNDTGHWWEVNGGSATSDGLQGWNYCPSSATLLGTEFNSNGFWVCYVPPPAPAAPSGAGTTTVAPSPSPPSAPTPTPTRQPGHLHVRIVMHWNWAGAQAWLTGLRFARMPRDATVTVRCRGDGCPRARVRGGGRRLAGLRRRLVHSRYRRGDHITITITAPGATPEVASIVIRDGRKPQAQLLKG